MRFNRFTRLMDHFHDLAAGDVFVGLVPRRHLRSVLIADLLERGVRLVPSATAQWLNASKCAQAAVLGSFMPELTRVVGNRRELFHAVNQYRMAGVARAVTKQDRLHCGHGVRRWEHLETLYSCMGFEAKFYPFVIQPFVETFTDVRVIMVADFVEAYQRVNEHHFRKNLTAGGRSRPHRLTESQEDFCRCVLRRGSMPYAHMDLMLPADGGVYLLEVRLNGGIRGAAIGRKALTELKAKQIERIATRR